MDFGAGGLFSVTPMADMMIGVVKSRLVRGQVVDEFDLATAYGARSRGHAIKELGEHVVAETTPEGFVEVRVEDRDRQRAADMANAFMEYLDQYHRRTSVENAARTSEFVTTALRENGERLDEATQALREFQRAHLAIDLAEQTRVTVEAIAQLEAERTRLELERGVLQGFSGPDQVRMRQIEAELREIGGKIDEFTRPDAGASGQASDSGVVVPLLEIPELAYELADLTREVMVLEKVRAYLSAQLEDARIQEAKDLEIIHVLDPAVPALKKSRPRRSLIVIITTALTFLASVGVAFLADGLLDYSARVSPSLGFGKSGPTRLVLRYSRHLKEWAEPGGGQGGSAPAGS
jgi:capsule polysaccharide export protein KpsE/RkpR